METKDMVDVIALILSIISALCTAGVFFTNRIYQKRVDTLNAINELQGKIDGFHEYKRLYNYCGKDAYAAYEKAVLDGEANADSKAYKDGREYYKCATTCLVELDHFSVGVNLGIYDINVVKKSGGDFYCRVYNFLKPVLDHKKETSTSQDYGEHYGNLTTMIKELSKFYPKEARYYKNDFPKDMGTE